MRKNIVAGIASLSISTALIGMLIWSAFRTDLLRATIRTDRLSLPNDGQQSFLGNHPAFRRQVKVPA